MTETLQEKSLQHTAEEELTTIVTTTPFAELEDRLQLAVRAASDKKAFELVAIDLRLVADFTEFFIIATGANTRQVQAISDEVEEQLKKHHDEKPLRIEGYQTAEWILLDYGDFVVHVFEKDARKLFDLERLWRDARKVVLPEELIN